MHRKRPFRTLTRSSLALRAWLRWGAVTATVMALVVVGLFFRFAEVGSYLILAYGMLALLLKIPSDTTFKMLLIVIACMPVLSWLNDDELMATMSVYAFLLLLIGTLSAIIEHIFGKKKYI